MQNQRPERIITLDFETYFSATYSLKSKGLNTSEYIRHPEFKTQCVSIKHDSEPVAWYRDRDVVAALDSIDWRNTALLCHHTHFDGFILSHHYGIVPAYYLDTLSMARALHSNSIGASLDEVARFYNLGNKLPDVLNRTKGVRDLPDDLMVALGQYCGVDTELCRAIYDRMIGIFPDEELELINKTVRMFCDPILYIDIPRVQTELKKEQDERLQTIEASGLTLTELGSANKFAAALSALGVDVPRKISPTTGKDTYAFSKTDLEFLDLKIHPDERVRHLVAGRFAAKSTIGESRAARFLEVGKDDRRVPVYLSYFGAHTGRWSGGNKMNFQNLKRGGELRKSIIAPEGHVIVVADSAQIEARVLAWLARDTELLALFANGEDVYKYMAAMIYRLPPEEITKDQRFIGKIATLGLGFGMGRDKFQHTLATGVMGPAVFLSTEECQRIVRAYRTTRIAVVNLWSSMDTLLHSMKMRRPTTLGPLRTDDENKIWLPNGLYLQYPGLDCDYDHINERDTNYRYFDYEQVVKMKMGIKIKPGEGHSIYGGLLTENIVQALARIIIGEQMNRIGDRLHETYRKYRRIVMMSHDEVVVVVPESEGESTLEMMLNEMKIPADWCTNLPLNAEGGYARNYSK